MEQVRRELYSSDECLKNYIWSLFFSDLACFRMMSSRCTRSKPEALKTQQGMLATIELLWSLNQISKHVPGFLVWCSQSSLRPWRTLFIEINSGQSDYCPVAFQKQYVAKKGSGEKGVLVQVMLLLVVSFVFLLLHIFVQKRSGSEAPRCAGQERARPQCSRQQQVNNKLFPMFLRFYCDEIVK